MKSEDEPLGASFSSSGGGQGFTLLSRGDRVRGRIAEPSGPGSHPLILIAGADGCASSASVDAALASWSEWSAVAAIDLPLCGGRHSDKLSLSELDHRGSLAGQLRADLEVQVASDLQRTFALLDYERAAFFGSGLGATLALPFCRRASGLRAIVLALHQQSNAPSGEHVRILAPDPRLDEAEQFLRARLL